MHAGVGTSPNSRSRRMKASSLMMRRLARLRWYVITRGTRPGCGSGRPVCQFELSRAAPEQGACTVAAEDLKGQVSGHVPDKNMRMLSGHAPGQ